MDTLTLQISPRHPAFEGHFPGTPVVPGAVLLDEAVRILATAANQNAAGCEIANAKFLSFVRPGESLSVEHEQRADGSIRFVIRTPDRAIASGTLAWTRAEGHAPHET
jgi:3-hydroxymyristoyl/3-hydroxydecanoyl-(acyl carrier protein) dehydratase